MKQLIIILTLIFSSSIVAQNVKFKNNKVYIDKSEIFTYKRAPYGSEYKFCKLNTDDEMFSISYSENGTDHYDGDDFVKVFFPKLNIKIESKNFPYGTNSRPMFEMLLFEKVLKTDGTIDEEKLQLFYKKFNENIEN